MNWGFRAWQSQPLLTKGEKIADSRVQLGSEDKVGLVAPRDIAVTIPAGISRGNMSVKVVYDGPVKAPIKAGQHIANLVVATGDTEPQRSEEHTSELQSLMRISYAVFCLKKKKNN